MTPNARPSPRPLVIYPHLHRNSQCRSCSTVIPGDICFNCGRLSTLLVTPRPPRNPTDSFSAGPALSQSRLVLRSKPFDSQYDLVETVLAAAKKRTQPRLQHRDFDSQISEIDTLLLARRKLASLRSLAAYVTTTVDGTALSSSCGRFACSPKRFSNSSKAHSACSSGSESQTLRSDSVTVSEALSEDGRPHHRDIARWLAELKPAGKSSAELTGRGVDCRLNLAGKSCEWVIFLE